MQPPPPPPAILKPKQVGFLQFSGEQELSANAFGRALLDATKRIRAVREYKDKPCTWVCNICESEFTLTGVLPTEPEARNAAKLGTDHKHPGYCNFCLQSWVKAKLDDNCVEIPCLMDKCKTLIDLQYMRTASVLPPALIKRWDSIVLMTCLMGMEDLRYCPACQEPAFIAPGCSDAQCPVCKFDFCPTCMFPKHAAIRCSAAVYELDPEVQRKFYQERLCNVWKAANTKACPQCHVAIQKNEGCSHMTCKSCSFQFCWICMQKYQGKYVTGAAANGEVCPCPPLPTPVVTVVPKAALPPRTPTPAAAATPKAATPATVVPAAAAPPPAAAGARP